MDAAVLEEIWQETKACLLKNIQKEEFEFKGNLLAYLVKIASRQIVARWRKERRYHHGVELEQTAGTSSDVPVDLLEDIERFHDTLNDKDQVALQIGMRFATDDLSRRGAVEVLAEKIRRAKAWNGSDAAISRRYVRLREKLRAFLRKEGYRV